jgi:cytochrome d ubiquinol oxidase subunit II
METAWFCLVAVMLTMYVVLDGFDLGAGIAHLFVARTDPERRAVLGSIGPVWDGNEVWLLAAGGTMHFAFPALPASSFSGFYLAVTIILWLLILRGISIEFRNHVRSLVWQPLWDAVFAAASALLALFFGAALGNVVRGVPLDPSGEFFLPLWTDFGAGQAAGILDWYTLLIAAAALVTLAVHGSLWVALRTGGEIESRARRIAAGGWWALVALVIVITWASFRMQPHLGESYRARPWGHVFPLLAAAGLAGIQVMNRAGKELRAFLCSCLFIIGMLTSAAFGLYPFLLPSISDPSRGLTVYNAAAPLYGLQAGLMWFIPGMILVGGYFIYNYRGLSSKVVTLPLLLVAMCLAASAQPPRVCEVRHDGAGLATAAIARAVAQCAARGGGTVYLPPGTYLSGTVHLRDNITLWLDAGATLRGTPDLAQYPAPAGAGWKTSWYSALVLAESARNVAVMGRGVIDGNRVFNPRGEERMRGPHALAFYDCRNVTVRDVSFLDAANYAVIVRSTEGLNIDGIQVRGGWDGINMHDTRNATISNCRLHTGDDSLAGAYWENVTVTNSILNSAANAIRAGGRNVLISNCLIYGPGESQHLTSLRHSTEAGFQILPHRPPDPRAPPKYVAPGPIDNMVLSNITMIGVRTPVYIAYSADAPYSKGSLGVGRIEFNNLTVRDAGRTPFYVSAPPGDPARSIVVRNARLSFAGGAAESHAAQQGFSPFSVLPSYAFYCRNVEAMELHDVRVTYRETDTRGALFADRVATLELDRFYAAREPGAAPSVQATGLKRISIDGRASAAATARVTGLDLPMAPVAAGDPFSVAATIENTGPDGMANVTLKLGPTIIERSVFLTAGDTASVRFLNLRHGTPGEIDVEAGKQKRKLRVLPPAAGETVRAPYLTFQNVDAQLRQLDHGFYIRAAGDYPVMQYGDQYGAIYLPGVLGAAGTVIVRLENPDLRGSWVGRAGIMVRAGIGAPGKPGAYVTLASSPSCGASLEWDGAAAGRLDQHTPVDGYTRWPHWLKLERRGARFTGYWSPDGAHWEKTGEAEIIGAADTLDAGMFAFRSSARFTDFRVE